MDINEITHEVWPCAPKRLCCLAREGFEGLISRQRGRMSVKDNDTWPLELEAHLDRKFHFQ